MATTTISGNLVLQVTLCNTGNPPVSRMLSVPSEMAFTDLHEAIATAFGWLGEPCTSWVFKMVDQGPLTLAERDDPNQLPTDFAAFWVADDKGPDATSSQRATALAIGEKMSVDMSGKYWVYDYNIARHQHAIEVVTMQCDNSAHKQIFVGGIGSISRNAWQLSDLTGLETTIQVEKGTWVGQHNAVRLKLDGIQAKFEERKDIEAKKGLEEIKITGEAKEMEKRNRIVEIVEIEEIEEAMKTQEKNQMEEMKKIEEAKKIEDKKKMEEKKKLEESKKIEEVKKTEERKRREEIRKTRERDRIEQKKEFEEGKKRAKRRILNEMKARESRRIMRERKRSEERKEEEEAQTETVMENDFDSIPRKRSAPSWAWGHDTAAPPVSKKRGLIGPAKVTDMGRREMPFVILTPASIESTAKAKAKEDEKAPVTPQKKASMEPTKDAGEWVEVKREMSETSSSDSDNDDNNYFFGYIGDEYGRLEQRRFRRRKH